MPKYTVALGKALSGRYSWTMLSPMCLIFEQVDNNDIVDLTSIPEALLNLLGKPMLSSRVSTGKWGRGGTPIYIVQPFDPHQNKELLYTNLLPMPFPKVGNPAVAHILNDRPYIIDLDARYQNCPSLMKHVDCSECESYGLACAVMDRPDVSLTASPITLYGRDRKGKVDWDKLPEEVTVRLLNSKREITYTLANPAFTTRAILPKLRSYTDHELDKIDEYRQARKDSAKKGASTRKFRKNNCEVCPMEYYCKKWYAQSCEGYWKSDAEIAKDIVENYWETDTHTYDRHDVILAGVLASTLDLPKRVERKKVYFSGYRPQTDDTTIVSLRGSFRSNQSMFRKKLPTPAGMRDLFGLPHALRAADVSDELFALYLSVSYLVQQYTRNSGITYIDLEDRAVVTYERHYNRGVEFKNWYKIVFRSFEDVFRYGSGNIPLTSQSSRVLNQ